MFGSFLRPYHTRVIRTPLRLCALILSGVSDGVVVVVLEGE
jgi:hypothetical protein